MANLTNATQKKIVENFQQELRNLVDFYGEIENYTGFVLDGQRFSAQAQQLAQSSMGFVLAAQDPNYGIGVKTLDGAIVVMKGHQLLDFYIKINNHHQQTVRWCQTQYAAIAEANSVDQLTALAQQLKSQITAGQAAEYLKNHTVSTPRLFGL